MHPALPPSDTCAAAACGSDMRSCFLRSFMQAPAGQARNVSCVLNLWSYTLAILVLSRMPEVCCTRGLKHLSCESGPISTLMTGCEVNMSTTVLPYARVGSVFRLIERSIHARLHLIVMRIPAFRPILSALRLRNRMRTHELDERV